MLRLLKNAESNADAKNLDLEDLFIKNIVVQQAPVRLQFSVVIKRANSVSYTENTPSYIPCSWSNQSVPRAPDPRRNRPLSIRCGSREEHG
jgi:hypothetical protein